MKNNTEQELLLLINPLRYQPGCWSQHPSHSAHRHCWAVFKWRWVIDVHTNESGVHEIEIFLFLLSFWQERYYFSVGMFVLHTQPITECIFHEMSQFNWKTSVQMKLGCITFCGSDSHAAIALISKWKWTTLHTSVTPASVWLKTATFKRCLKRPSEFPINLSQPVGIHFFLL